MLWGKKKKLLNELIFFYIMTNMNVQLAHMLQSDPKTLAIFKANISLLSQCMAEVLFKLITPVDVQKITGKELDLKKIWEQKNLEVQKPPSSEDKESVNDSPDFYS